MRVLFVTAGDETMASTRYRILNALPFLEDAGITYDILTASSNESHISFALRMLREAAHNDVIYIQKHLFPPLYCLPPVYHQLLSSISALIVYDLDDALYTSQPWHEGTPYRRRIQLNSVLRAASFVVTGNVSVSEYVLEYNDSVQCLPTALPKQEYEGCKKSQTANGNYTTLGWIGNPENLWYLSQVEDPIVAVLSNNDDLQLQLITDTSGVISLPFEDRRGEDVVYKEWSPDQELDLLAESDIVIRPLTNDEWTRGKGGYTSVVQSMALGIPVVVTPVSMLSDLVMHGESGYHATTESEWKQYLTNLVHDVDERRQMGRKARKTINEMGLWTHQYADAISNIIHFAAGDTPDVKIAENYASCITNKQY